MSVHLYSALALLKQELLSVGKYEHSLFFNGFFPVFIGLILILPCLRDIFFLLLQMILVVSG